MSPRRSKPIAVLALVAIAVLGGGALAEAAPAGRGPAPAHREGHPVDEAIERYFTAGGHLQRARDIAWCESSLNPGARSAGGGNHGMFQINNVHARQFQRVTGLPFAQYRYDADANAHYARWLFDREGWEPWGCA
jgi:hypothetical protein